MPDGAELIAAERGRQVSEEGWSNEHDDSHERHDLAYAAACYAAPDRIYVGTVSYQGVDLREAWPWGEREDKRDRDVRCWYPEALSDVLLNEGDSEIRERRIRELVKAGALVAAEIDRLLRIEVAASTPPTGGSNG